jgi:tRNA dimethylallyltransferase
VSAPLPPHLPPHLPPRFPVIVGPTAGGKSCLAVEVALAFASRQPSTPVPIAGEILTADAFQLYRGMDIGTAKPTLAERKNIPHHLIDVCDPRDPTPFTVHDWLHAAEAAIADCRARHTIPILVGGTHLYIQNFLTGMFQGPGADEALRAELRARGLVSLREELERVDPDAARRIHPNDERRTIRALEVFRLTGTPISEHQKQWGAESRTDCVLVILDWPTELINRRINARVKQMMAGGFLEEVQRLQAEGAFAEGANPQAREALGYKQLLAHLDGKCSLEEAVEQIKIDTRHFAKAQRTWLRRLRMTPGSVVIDAATTPTQAWSALVEAACFAGSSS